MPIVLWRCVPALILPLIVAGCGAAFPGFSEIEQPYLYELPVSAVTTQVQCEIYEFLDEKRKEKSTFFSRSAPIKIDLQLQTDFSGYVQYVGVDFSKVGLDSIATLIAQSNGKPTLGTKVQGKRSVQPSVANSVLVNTTHSSIARMVSMQRLT